MPMATGKKLYRSKKDRIIFGVCGGIAEYLGVDSTIVRLVAILLLFSGGWFFVLYLLLGIVIPENPNEKAAKMNVRTKDNSLLFGEILIGLGVFLTLVNYNLISWKILWPLILIALGGWLLWQNKSRK